jgi:hypothetical protein
MAGQSGTKRSKHKGYSEKQAEFKRYANLLVILHQKKDRVRSAFFIHFILH